MMVCSVPRHMAALEHQNPLVVAAANLRSNNCGQQRPEEVPRETLHVVDVRCFVSKRNVALSVIINKDGGRIWQVCVRNP